MMIIIIMKVAWNLMDFVIVVLGMAELVADQLESQELGPATYIYIYTHIHMCVYIYIYIYMYIHTYMHAYNV